MGVYENYIKYGIILLEIFLDLGGHTYDYSNNLNNICIIFMGNNKSYR